MKIGEKVLYNEKPYKIVFIYDSGYLELRPFEVLDGRFVKVILAHVDEVKIEDDCRNY